MKKGLIVTGVLFSLALALSAPTVCFASEAVGADTDVNERDPILQKKAKWEPEKLLGDESDGSRAVPIHLIPLFDEEIAELDKKSHKISPDDKPLIPFSTRQTCGECHSYQTISKGWHFNAVDANVVPGRPGEPWIFVDPSTGTQIPLSYRPWPGAYHPEQLGITPFRFTCLFGGHMPGGGPGEFESDNIDEIMRQGVSGKLEINCLSCHNANPAQDQAEYAIQIARENFRWAAAASCEFASVSGAAIDMPDTYDPFMPEPLEDTKKVPPTITYRENTFDHENKVFFDIARKVPNERCYFCHSNLDVDNNGLERWAADEDVHLMAGLKCVDCHRNGIGHNIIRGYEGEGADSRNPLAAVSSCEGCHLGQKSSSNPIEGRLGAPVPEHPGIPPVHFDKLSCTACHSGPWPGEKTGLTKTSRAHRLGTLGINKSPGALPHILYPVFAKQSNGKIAPHKLLWPAFWGIVKDNKIMPINLDVVRKTIRKIFAKKKLPHSGDWRDLTSEDVEEGLESLAKTVEGKPVYISGGELYRLDRSKLTVIFEHDAARPYLWPIAHDVRPAAQSLGIRSCGDCHSTDSPFFFGAVAVDSPLATERKAPKEMIEFQDINRFYVWAFAFSFVFRPWLKVVALGCCGIIGGVILLYALRALACIVKVLAGKS